MAVSQKSKKRIVKKKNKRKFIFKIIMLCTVSLVLAFFVKIEIDVFSEISKNNQEYTEKTKKLEEIELEKKEKDEIRQNIADGNLDDEKILKVIRDRGYVFPDEKVYIDITGN